MLNYHLNFFKFVLIFLPIPIYLPTYTYLLNYPYLSTYLTIPIYLPTHTYLPTCLCLFTYLSIPIYLPAPSVNYYWADNAFSSGEGNSASKFTNPKRIWTIIFPLWPISKLRFQSHSFQLFVRGGKLQLVI